MEWDWNVAIDVLPKLGAGLIVTVQATFVGAFFAYVIGLFIAILKMSKMSLVRGVVYWTSEFIRRTPLLVQLYFLFYVLPDLGIFLSPFVAGVIGLGLHFSTYTSEVFRAGIENVPRGQWDAARALNYSPVQTWKDVILPQAIPPMIPPLANYLITMFKETPLLAAITVVELFNAANIYTSNPDVGNLLPARCPRAGAAGRKENSCRRNARTWGTGFRSRLYSWNARQSRMPGLTD